MPGRSPHRHSPPPPPMISRRSPVLRGRMRSPERRRPVASGSPRPRRPADFRTGSARRSRSPIGKSRSLSPPVKRNLSPKRIRETSRRPPPPPSGRKLSRSKSPISSPRLPSYKAGPSTSSSVDRFRSGSYEREKVQFRGPEGSIAFDVNELKKVSVDIIRRNRGPVDENSHINRAITNPEEIIVVRRPGMRRREMPSSYLSNGTYKPDWTQDHGFHHHKDFQNQIGKDEGIRPIFMRPELMAVTSKDGQSDEYRRIVAIDSVKSSDRDRSKRETSRPRDSTRYSPARYEERSRPYYSSETRERPRSPAYSTSRRSPPRDEFYEGREKVRDERRGSSREDLRKRDDGRYPERHSSYERERINENRSGSHHRHEDRHYERDRRRSDHLSSPPPRERRRGSIETVRPSRGDGWERDHERESGGERRKRAHSRSREREDGRVRGSVRERPHHDEFDHVQERPRRYPFKPEYRGYFKEEVEFIPVPIRGRGAPLPIRRGFPVPMIHGRPMMRGAPRGFRVPFIRGVPPRGAFMGMRGGFIPRFYPPF